MGDVAFLAAVFCADAFAAADLPASTFLLVASGDASRFAFSVFLLTIHSPQARLHAHAARQLDWPWLLISHTVRTFEPMC
ncbi:MAG: hypothetical protein NZM24_08290 [Burkholderiaceae bacterium]|nr:hypothetical protein [Burkholderiaceae bacterium]MCX7900816.1 hypothetical protein [Burkholderiaceae bacterium]